MPSILDIFSKENYAFVAHSQERNDMSHRVIRHMLPNHGSVDTAQFLAMSPPCSIAGDGFCRDEPWFNLAERKMNANHHAKCMRFATLSATMQIVEFIRHPGWKKVYYDEEGTVFHLFILDNDPDVIGMTHALENVHLIGNAINPMANRYYHVTDIMDRYNGVYPWPEDLKILEQHAWTVEPYFRFRKEGGLDKKPRSADAYNGVIDEACERINKHLRGEGGSINLRKQEVNDYKVLRQGTHWSLVREIGTNPRIRMYNEGIHAMVSVRERTDGRLAATINVFDPCSPFYPPDIIKAWNEEDGLGPNDDRHGGGDTNGGTSYTLGTKMSIERLFQVTEEANLRRLSQFPFQFL